MEVAALVLEYLKVFLGFSVTVPVTILTFCLLFRARISAALDALLEVTFPGGSAKFERRKEALAKFNADVHRTAEATAQSAPKTMTAPGVVDTFLSIFTLAARLLPLIPKADRTRFIQEETASIPPDFQGFRTALLKLADEAPEVPARNAGDVFISGAGTVRFGEAAITPIRAPGSNYKV
jgi:hypothetical protein